MRRKSDFANEFLRCVCRAFGCRVWLRAGPRRNGVDRCAIVPVHHGCAPIPVTRAMSAALQRTDPRCGNTSVRPEDAEALRQLDELTKTLARPAK